MPRYKKDPPVIRVYTVCDESRYLIVRNVPALGCGDELLKLFATYGDIEDFKPMDAEDSEPFTDVYWIKFRLVSYAPQFESLSDTKDKLEGRRKEVLARLNSGRSNGLKVHSPVVSSETSLLAASSQTDYISQHINSNGVLDSVGSQHINNPPIARVSSDQEYFPSDSMNQTVKLVREKLNKIQSSTEHIQGGSAPKKTRIDNRRRI
ncbi:hypothetical protein JCGZ_02963 [Jatropha curcas]|uniref:RNA-binding protein 48 n=1 Tax=Jatropha curcas TaxID=180498 RepID=A0A067L4W7_JATCU|nr:hypothetical protein JCGZ_02963 [Jatropha curcas]